ncbi:hypothetical protein D915_002795 [Fasciola hepatica]|uniref:Uncharacterized protein n=1 Tax=Fasciola hepatica TaxID=6192 RepID=A0A4E0RJ84_FASHE|nr:hypothetical protein D915_002795 [Fasciola hepatica]
MTVIERFVCHLVDTNQVIMSARVSMSWYPISLLIAVMLNAYLINAAVYSPFSMESEPAEYEYPEPAAYWNWRRPVHGRVGPSATPEGRVNKKSFLLDSRLG